MAELFRFKYFNINQEGCAMKVGTDSMLLGSLTELSKTGEGYGLDIGAGTGVLSLMLAQRSQYIFHAIEPDDKHAERCVENFEQSYYTDRLQVFHTTLQDFVKSSRAQYDLIISNPPYFPFHLEEATEQRRKSRSSLHLPMTDLVFGTAALLKESGKAWFIFPKETAAEAKEKFRSAGFYLEKNIRISSYENSPVIREICCFTKMPAETVFRDFFIYASEKKYSAEYLELTKEYHGVAVT